MGDLPPPHIVRLQPAEARGLDPHANLRHAIARIADHAANRVHGLRPWNLVAIRRFARWSAKFGGELEEASGSGKFVSSAFRKRKRVNKEMEDV
ncbi:MAG: hypothetical protein P4L90_04635 [Rhodopila sp.]|nr:hypothetical protein [Rhodopila sp.]